MKKQTIIAASKILLMLTLIFALATLSSCTKVERVYFPNKKQILDVHFKVTGAGTKTVTLGYNDSLITIPVSGNLDHVIRLENGFCGYFTLMVNSAEEQKNYLEIDCGTQLIFNKAGTCPQTSY